MSSGQAGGIQVNQDCLLGWYLEGISCVFSVSAYWPLLTMNLFNMDNWLPYKDFTDSQFKSFLQVYHKFGFSDISGFLLSKASSSPVKQWHQPTL